MSAGVPVELERALLTRLRTRVVVSDDRGALGVGDIDGSRAVEVPAGCACVWLAHDRSRRFLTWIVRAAVVVETAAVTFLLAIGHRSIFGAPSDLLVAFDTVHVVEVLASLFTAHATPHEGLVAGHEAAKRYARTWLLLDILAIVPFYLASPVATQLIKLVRLRHLLFAGVGDSALEAVSGARRRVISLALVRVLTVLMVLHLGACAYYAVCSTRPAARLLWTDEDGGSGGGSGGDSGAPSWEPDVRRFDASTAAQAEENGGDFGSADVAGSGTDGADALAREYGALNLYVCALYVCCALLRGDAVASADATTAQRLVGMALMGVGLLLLLQLIADVIHAAGLLATHSASDGARVSALIERCDREGAPRSERRRARLRCGYAAWRYGAWSSVAEAEAADGGGWPGAVSPPLASELASPTALRLVRSLPLFARAAEACARSLAARLVFRFYLTGDYVYREGAAADAMHWILDGIVQLRQEPRATEPHPSKPDPTDPTDPTDHAAAGRVLAHLSAPEYLGEAAMLHGSDARGGEPQAAMVYRRCSAVASTLLDLYTLHASALAAVSSEHPPLHAMLGEVARDPAVVAAVGELARVSATAQRRRDQLTAGVDLRAIAPPATKEVSFALAYASPTEAHLHSVLPPQPSSPPPLMVTPTAAPPVFAHAARAAFQPPPPSPPLASGLPSPKPSRASSRASSGRASPITHEDAYAMADANRDGLLDKREFARYLQATAPVRPIPTLGVYCPFAAVDTASAASHARRPPPPLPAMPGSAAAAAPPPAADTRSGPPPSVGLAGRSRAVIAPEGGAAGGEAAAASGGSSTRRRGGLLAKTVGRR